MIRISYVHVSSSDGDGKVKMQVSDHESDTPSDQESIDSQSTCTDDSIIETDLIWLANQADQEAVENALTKEAVYQSTSKETFVNQNRDDREDNLNKENETTVCKEQQNTGKIF